MIPLLVASAVLTFPTSATFDDAWPGWRGAQGAGVATGSPPLRWSESENVRWKVAIPGKGLSCPVVFGELVFLTTAVPTGEAAKPDAEGAPPPPPEGQPEPPAPGGGDGGGEGGEGGGRRGRGEGGGGGQRGGRGVPPTEQEYVVLALNRADGSVAWSRTARIGTPHQGTHGDGSFASPTVVTNGELVIASFGSPGIFAYDMKGELLWELDLGDMDIMRGFGEGSSPVLAGDTVVIDWEHEGESFLVALDAMSGDERWRVTRSQGTSWATPLVVERAEGTIVVVPGTRTTAYDLATGAEVWSHGQLPPARAQGEGGRGGGGGGGLIASPVRHGDLVLLSTGGRSGGFTALRIAGSKGELDAEKSVAWTQTGDAPHVPSPIAYDGIFYSPKGDTGVISAFDVTTGEKLYGPERLATVANLYASPVAADGRLYFAGRDGEIDVIAAGPALEVLASNKLDDRFDSSPAIVGDELYLRGLKHLYCIAATEGAK